MDCQCKLLLTNIRLNDSKSVNTEHILNFNNEYVRNYCSVNLIKSELIISLSLQFSENGFCFDFINLVIDDTAFLNAIKSFKNGLKK